MIQVSYVTKDQLHKMLELRFPLAAPLTAFSPP